MVLCVVKIWKIRIPVMVLLALGAVVEANEAKTLQSDINSPLVQVRNFAGITGEKRYFKRSVRAESSSESEENVGDKVKEVLKEKVKESESDDRDSSDSEGDRRLSTKGLVPEDFEPERNPRIHERYSKDSESE